MPHQVYKNKDGIKVPSVTTIISDNLGWNKNTLLAWQARMFKDGKDPTKIKKDAADIGTLVHLYIESFIANKEIDNEIKKQYNMEAILIAEAGIDQFIKQTKEHDIEYTATELPFVSETYRYGGCLDFLYRRPGIKCGIGDNKTSKGIYPEYFVQLGGYYNLVIENTDHKPEECLFVKISKDITKPEDDIVKFIFVPINKLYTGFEVFKHLIDFYNFKKELVLEN